ncbi:MAG: sulfite exporter TauE/SafE family protein [Crocinitomicaceae bacterium]
MLADYFWILFCIPAVAFLYASVGHGGASGYIALMYLFHFSQYDIKPIALVMNLFVAAIAFFHYWRQGFFRFNVFIIFALGSVPFSFMGGYISISPLYYNLLLAIFILISVLKLSGSFQMQDKIMTVKFNPFLALFIGVLIGFSSGLIGIGGGIILTPIILLFNWGTIKEAAAISALFIWVNSAAALVGQLSQGVQIPKLVWLMVAVAILGGFAGSYLGAKKMNNRIVKRLLLIVLSIALVKLIYSLWQMI